MELAGLVEEVRLCGGILLSYLRYRKVTSVTLPPVPRVPPPPRLWSLPLEDSSVYRARMLLETRIARQHKHDRDVARLGEILSQAGKETSARIDDLTTRVLMIQTDLAVSGDLVENPAFRRYAHAVERRKSRFQQIGK